MARVLTVCSLLMMLLVINNAHLISAISDGEGNDVTAAASARKLGKHNYNLHSNDTTASSPSPSEALKAEESGGVASPEQVIIKTHHHHHHRPSIDKSVAGGGVILGGLAAIFLVAVFCYIRATRRKTMLPAGSPTGGGKTDEPGSATTAP